VGGSEQVSEPRFDRPYYSLLLLITVQGGSDIA
jgi:hypothetical protein